VFCQLETLRHCLPPSVRRTLNELPESLDETYERVLKEIKKPNRDHARRLLQCLVAAVRPFGVKELAEVLAVDFDDEEGIPKLKPNWRWEDQEQAILTSCSSLITVVETGDSRVVQFSHFSVKEYLTSERLATSSGDVSRYHVDLRPAHTILAEACMSVLLQPEDHVEENGVGRSSPLAGYAAQHWVTHAQFEGVSSFLRKAMEDLFDLDKPYFPAWLQLHNIDTYPDSESSLYWFAVSKGSNASPLYYAALCGFQDLVEHLVVKYPQHVDNSNGCYMKPLIAALAGRHFQTAKLLGYHGARANVSGKDGRIPLHSATWYGDLEIVQVLLDYEADVNARDPNNWTPIHYLSEGNPPPETPHNNPELLSAIARLLLEHGAEVNARTNSGLAPLHVAAQYGRVEVARVLLDHGANVGAEDDEGRTPIYVAANYGRAKVAHMLLEHGANVGAGDNNGKTPLYAAVEHRNVEVVRVLLEHGANVGAGDNEGRTPFQIASAKGYDEIMKLLSEHGTEGML
jgi:ankyrin repeat protein